MKKHNITWLKVWFTYQRSTDTHKQSDSVTFSTEVDGEFSKSKLNKVIKDYFLAWKGEGEIVVTSADCGAHTTPEFVQNWLDSLEGRKIKFNDQKKPVCV